MTAAPQTTASLFDNVQPDASLYPITISLNVAEDYYLDDARLVVLADGLPIGGVQTATMIYGAGWQTISLSARLTTAPSMISVQFINDAWGGSKALDRNLYVQSITLNGGTFQGVAALNQAGGVNKTDAAGLHTDGAINFIIPAAAPPPPPPPYLETVTVSVSEDAYLGNAQFVVLADGIQLGGVETAAVSHAAGQWQSVTISAELARAPSTIQVSFINDAWGGTLALDRNLYVNAIHVNGVLYAGDSATNQASGSVGGNNDALYTNGTMTFNVAAAPPVVTPAGQLVFRANDYISVADAVQFDRTQAWSMTTTINVAQPAPGPSAGLPDGGAELIFGNTNGAPYSGFEAWIDDQGHLRVREMSDFLSGNYIDVTGRVDIADGTPHFIGVSYDGSSTAAGVTLYVDGQTQQTTTLANNLTGSTLSGGPLIIGNQLNGWQNQFELAGGMSDFSISNVARPASYFSHGQLPPVDAATQIAFSFASNTGTEVTDLSGHSNTGMLSTPSLWQS